MPFILIKNNIKLMLRNKIILVVMAVLPVIIIALLSNVFGDLLSGDYSANDFTCGYQIEEGSDYNDFKEQLEDVLDENGITLKSYDYDYCDYEDGFNNGEFDVIVKIGKESYTIYRDENKLTEAAIAEYIFSNYFEQHNNQVNIMTQMFEQGLAELKDNNSTVKSEKIDADKVPDAINYYGIVYVIFFSWCTPIVTAVVISSERVNRITKRFNISPMSRRSFYLGKLIPSVCAGIVLTAISMLVSTLVFDIQWGNYLQTIAVLVLQIIACNALGIVIFYLFNNNAISIALLWMMYMFFGLVGGTFATYMYSGMSETVLRFSPIYYENRTLIEFATKGMSEYRDTCIFYLVAIFLVCTLIGMLLMNKRMESEV